MLYFDLILPYLILCLFEMCSNVCTCLVCCSFVLSKCIECMLALFRQRAVRGSWVCCWRPPWATTWWRQVSSDPLCPIYFIIHCPAYYEQPKDWLAFYLPCPWLPFGLLWLASCYRFTLINEHDEIQWWYYDFILDMMIYLWHLGDSGCFPSTSP